MNAIWIAVAAVSLLGLAFGAILGYASRRFAVEDDPVAPTRKPSAVTVKKSTVAPQVAKL